MAPIHFLSGKAIKKNLKNSYHNDKTKHSQQGYSKPMPTSGQSSHHTAPLLKAFNRLASLFIPLASAPTTSFDLRSDLPRMLVSRRMVRSGDEDEVIVRGRAAGGGRGGAAWNEGRGGGAGGWGAPGIPLGGVPLGMGIALLLLDAVAQAWGIVNVYSIISCECLVGWR